MLSAPRTPKGDNYSEKRLTDKNGVALNSLDVIYNGIAHHQFIIDDVNGIYLLNCDGYTHDITHDLSNGFECVGTFKELEHLFKCD